MGSGRKATVVTIGRGADEAQPASVEAVPTPRRDKKLRREKEGFGII
ncbi:hypothetical protein PMI07_003164 [Rhizobium sp. CF080]|nr:hypothetical protein PMI07_003164 [Rhizobium sp. CF080]